MAEEFQNQNAEIEDDSAFDSAFDEAVNGVETANEDDVETPAPEEAQPEDEPSVEDSAVQDMETEDDGADYRHKFSSAMGRLKASQQQNKELNDQLAQMREQLAAFQAGMQGSAQQQEAQSNEVEVDGLDEVPEELHALFKDDSADGARLRRMLEEYGPDYAITIAETVKERRELQQFKAQAQNERAKETEEKHFRDIANAVPEYADILLSPDRKTKLNELVQGVKAWIATLPYGEGVEMDRVVNDGTPDEVISMLRSYSKFRNGSPSRSASAVRNLARSNMAVPASRSAPPSKRISKDDFDAAFEEFSRS